MYKSIRYLTLLIAFLLTCLCADAQYFKPVWVNDIGGTEDSKATNIATDNNGNVYVSGYIRGTSTFNLKQGGSKKLTSNGDADIYIAKYDIAAGAYVWAISMGGGSIELPNSMAVDNQGNVLITGQFTSTTNFNPKGNFQLSPNGADDIFIAKYTSNGDFVWATSMGGPGIDRGHYITTDNQGNVLITASYTFAIDADPSAAVYSLPDQGSLACFFAKYDANGKFLWAHPLGRVSQQNLTSIAVDKTTNDIVIAGDFSGNVDFSYSGDANATFSSPGISDFIARYSNNGVYKWVKYLPGSGSAIVSSLKIDKQSNIIITGSFGGQFYPDGQNGNAIFSQGSSDVLLASYTSGGNLNWAKNFGSNNSDVSIRYVGVDDDNNLYITGYFTGTVNIDPALSDGVLSNNSGGRSALIAAFRPSGKAFAAGAFGSSCSLNLGYEIVPINGDVYVAGSFCQTEDFDTGSCQVKNVTAINDISDSFLARFSIEDASTAKITALSIPQQVSPATINQGNHTITLTVAAGTNVKALVPAITINGGTLSPASGVSKDFTSPVIYTLTVGCTAIPYTVKVILTTTVTPVTVCAGAQHTLTGDVVNPAPDSYSWQVFQNNVWVNAPGVINIKDYQTASLPNATAANIIYSLRRKVTVQGNDTFDSFFDVTIQPAIAIANNTITTPAVASFCITGDPAIITGNTPSGGNSTYTYQWQSSADNVTFADIAGAVAKDYGPPAVNANAYFRRVVTSGSCATPLASNVVSITVQPAVTNNTITAPAVTAFCSTGDPLVIIGSTPLGGSGTYTYQWQSSADNVTFADVAGAIAKDYDPPVTNANTYYRRTVTSGACLTPVISNVVKITISIPVTNNTISYAISCSSPSSSAVITGSVPVGGVFTYQWQNSADGVNYTDINGETAKDYNPGALPGTAYYRRMVISAACSVPSNVIKIDLLGPIDNNFITPPAITAFCLNGDPGIITGTVPTGGDGNYTYVWQSSANNTGYDDIPGATSKDFDPPAAIADVYYRRMIISGNCITRSVSNTIHITILQNISNNVITTPAVTAFCTSGNPGVITGNVPSGGNNTYAYQWQSSANNINFIDIQSAVAKDYDPATINSTTYYRRIVSSAACGTPILSNVITITITPSPATPVVVNPVIGVCPGSGATLSVASPQQGIIYNWYDSPSKNNLLFTGANYATGALNIGKTYYVEATNGTCSSPSLASAQVIINAVPALPLVTSPVAVCNGSAASLSVSNPQVGLTYNWYTTITGGNPVFTGTDFTTLAITTNTIYYVDASNNSGCSSTRATVNINVNPLPQVTAQGASICPGTSTTLTASSTDQNATIKWYDKATGGNLVFTGTPFSTGVLNANAAYYAEAVDNISGCISATRGVAQVQMIQPLAAPVVNVGETTVSSITFKWDAVSGATGYQVSIDNGGTFISPSSGSNGLTHTVTGLQSLQSVTIIVQATGGSSCQLSGSSTAVTGTATSPLGNQIFVANAFTPNGDGKNDVVYVHGANIASMKFYVYDQWGELLYASVNQANGWDGTYKGTKEPVGVYVYYVEAVMNDGQKVKKKGTITLLR